MKKVLVSFAALALVFSIYSCRETTEEKAEDAVEATAQDTEDNVEAAGNAVEDAANEAGEEIEEEIDETDDMDGDGN